ncbi:MAG: hypothetical protein E4G77_03455 [Nitrosopumilus sp.]|jgi:hypothetical protein|nr:MAG: hypothetical protein E4G77_03455 [Nitrosopumilus sp.]
MSETNNGTPKAEIIAKIKRIQTESNKLKTIKKEDAIKSASRKTATNRGKGKTIYKDGQKKDSQA